MYLRFGIIMNGRHPDDARWRLIVRLVDRVFCALAYCGSQIDIDEVRFRGSIAGFPWTLHQSVKLGRPLRSSMTLHDIEHGASMLRFRRVFQAARSKVTSRLSQSDVICHFSLVLFFVVFKVETLAVEEWCLYILISYSTQRETRQVGWSRLIGVTKCRPLEVARVTWPAPSVQYISRTIVVMRVCRARSSLRLSKEAGGVSTLSVNLEKKERWILTFREHDAVSLCASQRTERDPVSPKTYPVVFYS